MPTLELLHVSPSVLCVRRPRYLSASYIVHDTQGIVLVDAGMEADGSDMLEGLKAIDGRPEEVTAILLTHWHNDHSAGAEALRRLSGAPVFYHELEAPNFRHVAVGRFRRALSDALPEHGPASALKAIVGQSPPNSIREATTLRGGELVASRFQAIHTPGHSRGHLSFVYLPERVLFAGDAIAVCFNRLWFISRFLTEDLVAARSSMLQVAGIEASAICPGHRGPLGDPTGENRRAILEYLNGGGSWPLFS